MNAKYNLTGRMFSIRLLYNCKLRRICPNLAQPNKHGPFLFLSQKRNDL